jgi:biotin carboxylase
MRPPAVYLIGGGPLAVRVPGWARDCGLAPLVADRDPRAPGFAAAAERIALDGTDADGHVAAARELATRYDVRGAYCGGEHGVESARRVAEALGLSAPPRAALARALDKVQATAAFRAAGLATPGGVVVADGAAGEAQLAALLAESGRPWIVKPSGGSGSRGVRVVGARADVPAALDAARSGAPGRILAEPFLAGRSIDANGCFLGGRYVPCGTLEKFETPLPERLPLGGEDPARLTPAEAERVHALLAAGARALGLDVGPVKGDLLWTADGPVLLEVAPRFHGDVTTANTLPFGSGLSPYHLWFRFLAAGSVDARAPGELAAGGGHGAWRVLCLPPGRVRARQDVALPPGVTCAWRNPRAAERISRYGDTTAVPGYLCARGRDRAAAEGALRAYLAAARDDVEPDPEHAEWYASLGRALRAAGLDPRSAAIPASDFPGGGGA